MVFQPFDLFYLSLMPDFKSLMQLRRRHKRQSLLRQRPGRFIGRVHLFDEVALQVVPIAGVDHLLLVAEVVQDI